MPIIGWIAIGFILGMVMTIFAIALASAAD
jgi:hypothetical protein